MNAGHGTGIDTIGDAFAGVGYYGMWHGVPSLTVSLSSPEQTELSILDLNRKGDGMSKESLGLGTGLDELGQETRFLTLSVPPDSD